MTGPQILPTPSPEPQYRRDRGHHTVPDLGPVRGFGDDDVIRYDLTDGLHCWHVRRPGMPVVQVRLVIPTEPFAEHHSAVCSVLPHLLLAGSGDPHRHPQDRATVADLFADLGTRVDVSSDGDHLVVSMAVLRHHLAAALSLLTQTLVAAGYPDADVVGESERALHGIIEGSARAAHRARQSLLNHLYGGHPYACSIPTAAQLGATTATDFRQAHRRWIVPVGSTLILVGDTDPERDRELVEAAVRGWQGAPARSTPVDRLPPLAAEPSLLIHRPASVQSTIRIGGPALGRDDPRFAAMQIANLVYGGYFSSRLVRNIRENRGYTYSPRSHIEHRRAGSTLFVAADVATRYTAPTLMEMWYELGRLSTLRPPEDELNSVRQYALGALALSIAAPADLADTLASLSRCELDPQWVARHRSRIEQVTSEDVYRMGVSILAPCRLAVAVTGDADEVEEPLRAFGPWTVERSPAA